MKQAYLKVFTFLLFLSLIFSIIGCSSEDNPTDPNNPNDPNDPSDPAGIVQLLSVDFESTLSGWYGAPQNLDSSYSWDWSARFSSAPGVYYNVTGTANVVDKGIVSVSSNHAYTGSKSLLIEYQLGIASTISSPEYYYDVEKCAFKGGYGLYFYPIRKFSLLDYETGDSAFVSFAIKPIENIMTADGGSFNLRFIVRGAHGLIKEILFDSTYMNSHIGNWSQFKVDLTPYTGWENDIGIECTLERSGGYYCCRFIRGSEWHADIHNSGDSAKCVLAIDDLKICVIPSTGK